MTSGSSSRPASEKDNCDDKPLPALNGLDPRGDCVPHELLRATGNWKTKKVVASNFEQNCKVFFL